MRVAAVKSETSEGGHSVVDTQKPDAPSLAKEALDQADGDRERAVQILVDRVMTDLNFRTEHLATMARYWAQDIVRVYQGDIRNRIVKIANGDQHSVNLQNAMANEAIRLMDMILFGSAKRLGDATAAEVRESAAQYAVNAKTYTIKARWQAAVAKRVAENGTEDQRVRDVLTEKTLQSLWDEANA